MVITPLTSHDLRILHLASQDVEGRLAFHVTEDGTLTLLGVGATGALAGEDSFPRLVELGLLARGMSRTFILTPGGWDVIRDFSLAG